jgi:hypothetical protein
MASSRKEVRDDKLTLAKLASYDDILTDALLDRVSVSSGLYNRTTC